MIISGRQKPVEQLPDWALCCEVTRKAHIAEIARRRVVKVEAGANFKAEVECQVCHRITKNVTATLRVDGRREIAILIDLYDFDEGESCL